MNAECQPLLKQLISTTTEYSRLIATSGAQRLKSAERFSAKRLILILCSLGAVAAAIVLATLIHQPT